MNVAALIVSVVAALAAVVAVVYARRSERSAARSAVAAEATVALDAQRRHSEMTPKFRVTVERANPGIDDLRLTVFLAGPELERLDSLIVRIRDDHPWRAEGTPLAGGPTPEQVAAQIWGPYRFVPGTGPGASPGNALGAADGMGRVTPTGGMPVGEGLSFFLEPTFPPSWSQQPQQNWRKERGSIVRLLLECRREGWAPWTLPCEIDTAAGTAIVEVP